MYQKVTGQSKTTSPECCPHSKPRKASKVSIPRHFILSQESLWVCLYREHTETHVGYSGRHVHTHGQKKPCVCTQWVHFPPHQVGNWSKHVPSKGSSSSAAGQGNRAWLLKLAHIYSLSCSLQEICSCADLRILSPFPQSMEGHMKCTA